jgi:hypothetical protein
VSALERASPPEAAIAGCIDGQEGAARRRIESALNADEDQHVTD